MTYEQAIEFLQQHQPMPDTQIECANEEEARSLEHCVDQWSKALDYFEKNPSADVIPLFLNSLGDREGLSVYQSLTHYIELFSPESVIPFFKDAFRSESSVVRAAAADYAMNIDSGAPDFIEAIISLLKDSDAEVREAALNTLTSKAEEQLFDSQRYKKEIHQACAAEKDEEIKEMYEDLLALF